MPISGTVWAEVQGPNGANRIVSLDESGKGEFSKSFSAERSGIYQVRLRAKGRSMKGKPFTREAWRSISIYRNIPDRPTGTGTNENESLCNLIRCLLGQDSVVRFLKKKKLDAGELKKCLEIHCNKDDELRSIRSFKSGKTSQMKELKENRSSALAVNSSGQEEGCLDAVVTAPELRKVEYPEPKIPEMMMMVMKMPAFKLNDKGEFEEVIIDPEDQDDHNDHDDHLDPPHH
jgi:hypothetical protein